MIDSLHYIHNRLSKETKMGDILGLRKKEEIKKEKTRLSHVGDRTRLVGEGRKEKDNTLVVPHETKTAFGNS